MRRFPKKFQQCSGLYIFSIAALDATEINGWSIINGETSGVTPNEYQKVYIE